jgi:hypothetical protein
MSVDLLDITARSKVDPAALSAISDFTWRPSGRIPVADLLGSPDWTLYCLDPSSGQALFIELPPGSDLSEAVFVYSQQFTDARRAALMPFDQLVATSHAIAAPSELAFLFSTGRCGSTLASRIFARLPDVWSLSEPDYLTNLAPARRTLTGDEMAALIRAATLWTCRPPKARRPETIVIKPRSEAILIADACQKAFPDVRKVFMCRDHLGYVNSCFKFVQRVVPPEILWAEESWRPDWDWVMPGVPTSFLEECFAPDHGPIDWPELLTLMWDLRIDGYLRALRQGMSFTAIHYHDLNTDRTRQTRRLLEACGISPRHLDQAMIAFTEDSHKGSAGANAVPARGLTAEETARMTRLLALMGKRDYVDGRLPESRESAGETSPGHQRSQTASTWERSTSSS